MLPDGEFGNDSLGWIKKSVPLPPGSSLLGASASCLG